MIRTRLVATVLLALGTSAIAVMAAEPPPVTPPDPGRVNQPEQPERVIKVEIGFEPGPLEDPAVPVPSAIQTAEPPPAPSPATVPVPMPIPLPVVVTPAPTPMP